jgi:hypothetical protein
MESVQAHPLHWPLHRPRTKLPRRANFHRRPANENGYSRRESLSIADSRDRLYRELGLLGGKQVIISSNLELKMDGTPRGSQREPSDSGIAVYFQLNKQPHCLSCDAWDRCADNLAAVAKHVEAMRGQLRWGVADVASMFAGFKALPGAIITPAPMTVEEAAEAIVGNDQACIRLMIQDADCFRATYRDQAKRLHPDTGIGGDAWKEFQYAADVLKQHHGIA